MDWSFFEKTAISNDGDGGSAMYLIGTDQWLGILQYLPVPSVLAFGMTCRRFRDLANSDSLWALICKREWGSRALDAWPHRADKKLGWKRLHRQMLAVGSVAWRRLHQGDISPAARASHSMVAVTEKVALFGGGYDGGRHLDDTWVTCLPGDWAEDVIWHQTSAGVPAGRFGQSCTVVEDSLILFGGINDHGIRQSDTWINSLNMQGRCSWQLLQVASLPCARGAHAGCFAGDRKVVVHGGIGADGMRLDDTWLLDLSEKPVPAWHKVSTSGSPPARSGHTLTWIGGKCMILFGGRGTKFEVLNDVWLLDMEGELPVWVELRACELHPLRDCPPPRSGHSATLIFGGRVLIYGGEDSMRCRKGDVWVLDPSAGIPIGNVPTYINTLRCKTAGGNKRERKFWKKLKQWGQSPSKRSFHGACSVHSGREVLVFGGMVDGEVLPAAAAGLGFDAELYLLQLVP